jgi:molybdopterin/thiamine biosynthesis adenylyltransferase
MTTTNDKVEVIRIDRLNEDRYERAKRIGWFDLDRISKTKILIAGVGAIGNEVIKNLVLAGYKKLTLIDMDYVVRSNLNRCVFFTDIDADKKRLKAEVVAEKLKVLDPEVEVDYHTGKLQDMGDEFIPAHDIVLGCLDNIDARLHLNAHAYINNIPYIDGATDGLRGKVQVVLPPESSCLECSMNATHMKILEKRFSCTGADIVYFENKLPAEITTTAVISAIMVRETMKISCGLHDKILNNIFYYDGLRNVAEEWEVDINPDCPHHVNKDAR